jgi:UPF0271 protein
MSKVIDKKVKSMDFSCDIAQGFGIYKNNLEYDFLDYVSSVNVSAGLHCGDPLTINEALKKAKDKNLVIGVNIGFNDLKGFGLHAMDLSDDEIEALVIYQIGAVNALAKSNALEIEFVRCHGAMYKMASENYAFSSAIAKAIKKYSQWLSYVGQANDVLDRVENDVCITVVRELALNKNYKADCTIDYGMKDITDINALRLRFQKLINYSQLADVDGEIQNVKVDSIHFETNENSLELVKSLSDIYPPLPVNYLKAQASGWV